MSTYDDSDEFLDREPEVDAFARLLEHRRQRILLIHGGAGFGKTWLMRRLRQMCDDDRTVCTVLDFHTDKMLAEPKGVIERLRLRLGGRFDDQMERAEVQIDQYLESALAGSETEVGEWVSDDMAGRARGGGSGAYIAESAKVEAGGHFAGRDLFMIKDSTIVIDPGSGPARARARAKSKRNAAFRAALAAQAAEQRVIVFFDHFDEATRPVADWFYNHILDLHLAESAEFSTVWIVFAAPTIPRQIRVDECRHVLQDQTIGPLPRDVIYEYWVDTRGLDRATVDLFITGTQCNTKMLFFTLNNIASQAEQAGG